MQAFLVLVLFVCLLGIVICSGIGVAGMVRKDWTFLGAAIAAIAALAQLAITAFSLLRLL